jgi:hypothetical protein
MTAFRGLSKHLFAAPLLITATAFAVTSIDVDPVSPDAAVTTLAEESLALPAANVTYYSNALHTTIVGRFGYDCCNNPIAWGKKSKYATSGGCFPCVPPPI